VVGIAGTDEKCGWVRDELGTRRSTTGRRTTRGAGEDQPEERVTLCGKISDYTREQGMGITNLRHLIVKRARIEGFRVLDYAPRAMEAMQALGGWSQAGRLKYKVDLIQGLENVIPAMNRLLTGANTGKVIVKLAS
jgi:NADPH-dependent curcumin reductase CurA